LAKNNNITRLIPGEPVAQFGGMTPEQFGDFAGKIESILMGTFGSCDGAMTMYSHLASRLLLDVEDAAGEAAMEKVLDTFNAAIRDEIGSQRRLRAAQRQREPETNGNAGGLH
jgi:hypothetical protein